MSKEKKAAPEAERETKAPDPAEDGAQDAQECVSEDGAAVQTEIDDLQKQLEAAKKQSDEYLNMAQRVQADASEGEPGTVCLVLQKGYQLGDVVLRHAMVKVVAEA